MDQGGRLGRWFWPHMFELVKRPPGSSMSSQFFAFCAIEFSKPPSPECHNSQKGDDLHRTFEKLWLSSMVADRPDRPACPRSIDFTALISSSN